MPDTTQVYKWVRANFITGVNPAPGLSRDTPSRFMALKQEIHFGLMGYVARLQTFFEKECSVDPTRELLHMLKTVVSYHESCK